MNQPPEPALDDRLLRDFAAGQRDALGELARRHERSMLGLAFGLLAGRRVLAQDAVQETWVRVVRFAGAFAGQSGAKTWIYRILINQCRTMHESERMAALPAAGLEVVGQVASKPPPVTPERERGGDLRRQIEQLDAEKRGR